MFQGSDGMDSFMTACELLPPGLRQRIRESGCTGAEEIRLRCGQAVSLVLEGRERELGGDKLSSRELMQVLEKATGASLHSAAPAMTKGYISYKGLRIGLCGSAAISGEQLLGFRDFSSLAIRLPRECRGICSGFIDELTEGGLENTLIVSPPGLGKTTLLRELIRVISDRGVRVAVLDERGELYADGGFDLGRCSDVLSGISKELGAGMLLRGMNPQVIAMDEISRKEDQGVIQQIMGCGVTLFASAHGRDRQDMQRRPVYRELFESGAFKYILTIRMEHSRRRYVLETIQ